MFICLNANLPDKPNPTIGTLGNIISYIKNSRVKKLKAEKWVTLLQPTIELENWLQLSVTIPKTCGLLRQHV